MKRKDNNMENFVYALGKQENLKIERFHICTWLLKKETFITEYGLEINRGALKSLDIQIVLPITEDITNSNFRCLFENITNTKNCRFIFNSDIERISPINGNPSFGSRIEFKNDRKITAIPLSLGDNVNYDDKHKSIHLELDLSDDQISETIYVRFYIKTSKPSFAFEVKEITRKKIIYDVRVNECRTAPDTVINLQSRQYKTIPITKCFCFHIIPNSYNIEFVESEKLKTIRSLEQAGFSNYLGDIASKENITLKEHEFNIVFCKKDNLQNYSFFSVFSKEFIGDSQITLALAANILCGLLFAAGGLHKQTSDFTIPYISRISTEHWIALGILIVMIVYLIAQILKSKK
ncbi:MAG: hypothetical protein Q4F82_05290 [bacterium]|nr:hypothetical protein [bacterium]